MEVFILTAGSHKVQRIHCLSRECGIPGPSDTIYILRMQVPFSASRDLPLAHRVLHFSRHPGRPEPGKHRTIAIVFGGHIRRVVLSQAKLDDMHLSPRLTWRRRGERPR